MNSGHPSSPRRGGRRLVRSGGAVCAVVAAAVMLAACGSSSSSTTTTSTTAATSPSTTTPTDPASELSALISVPTANTPLSEGGSSLLYPLFSTWATAFHAKYPTVSITTAATGSGAGITGATNGTLDIGASDAYLPAATQAATPGLENIPLAISAQQVNYDVPGLPQATHLKLNGTILNDMYDGTITKWNASQIAAINPGVKLPDTTVVPLHRGDSSGDTFLFTSYLAAADPSGWVAKAGGPSPSITFPSAPGALAEQKNSGMVQGCQHTPGCVAYVGISYLTEATADGLGWAALANKSGNYELPTSTTILAEASSFTQVPANGSISLIYGPAPTGYPIINFEYAIVQTKQPSTAKAQAITSVLAWAMDPKGGSASSYLTTVRFEPLPAGALQVSIDLLKKIG